jgi:hypothetical protein
MMGLPAPPSANGFIEICTWLTAAKRRMQMAGKKTRPDADRVATLAENNNNNDI